MFEPSIGPRVFTMAPGADFPAALVRGCLELAAGHPPEELAKLTIYVNTRRMMRRVRELFSNGEPRLLPRISLITEIGMEPSLADVPLPVSPIRRRLELAQLIQRLIASDPTLAPETAVFDLADSLAALMDEMQGEGVTMADIIGLDVSDSSGHWARAQAFLSVVGTYLAADGTDAPDPEARQRMAVERLAARWSISPPDGPIIVAGSTGSRGTTLAFMEAVAALPQGAILLPGFDTDMPDAIWKRLSSPEIGEDHPQYRFARLFEVLDIGPDDTAPWPGADPAAPDRNRLVSLALRPAPVTNQWMKDGPALGDLGPLCKDLTLIEAPSPRAEAEAIAYLLREAAEHGQKAALVTPDRMLTRRVTSLLDRWDLEPDDSAGRPFALSPPGRLLRHTASLIEERPSLDALLSLLKHPLVHVGDQRGEHLRLTRDLELWLRSKGYPWPGPEALETWGKAPKAWIAWLSNLLADGTRDGPTDLGEMVAHHLDLTARAVAGHASKDGQALWNKPAGRKALEVMAELQREAEHGSPLDARDYSRLLKTLFDKAEVRDPEAPHPSIMIWGTLEARVQGADLVILGGLNEGTWPEMPAPDPWLNRKMRLQAGLLLPERRIGLSAHDFQQAIAAPKAVLSRTVRDDTTQPVPSRWLNRLTNLLAGLPDTGGPEALAAMRDRGNTCLTLAESLNFSDDLVPLEPRPSPRPPVDMRPRRLSFTEVERLIRDPYAIYARHVLGLRKLDPLRPEPDVRVKGRILHDIFDRFMTDWRDETPADPETHLIQIARQELAKASHWPVATRMLQAKVEQVAGWFVKEEISMSEVSKFKLSEVPGEITIEDARFTLHGRADRIDETPDGEFVILDYKSGKPPSPKEIEFFNIQLLLEALIAEEGGFEGLPSARVARVGHIGLGSNPSRSEYAMEDIKDRHFATATVRARFLKLIAAYDDIACGYTARRAMQTVQYEGDYDHLARFGEWDDSSTPTGREVG